MKKIFIFFVMILSGLSNAQDVKFSGQVRAKSILDNTDFSSKTDPLTYTELRSRLGLNFIPNTSVAAFFQLQDSRIYGTETGTTANMKNVDLLQAYGFVKDIFNLPIDLKLGRMQVKLANERLLGVSDWTNGRSFDGSELIIKTPDVNFNLYTFQTNEKNLPGDSLDSYFGGVSADIKSFTNYEASVFILVESISKSSGNISSTLGFYSNGKLGNYNHTIEATYQFGKIKIANRSFSISAFMFAYNFIYNFDFYGKPKAGGGIDFISGDKYPTDKKYQSFNTLYGTGHRFYGYMDYFTNIPNHTKNLGLVDWHVKFSVSPASDFSLNLNFHKFQSHAEYTKINGSRTNDFGYEIDFRGDYEYNRNLKITLGLSSFYPGEIFKEWKGKDNSLFGYTLFTFNL